MASGGKPEVAQSPGLGFEGRVRRDAGTAATVRSVAADKLVVETVIPDPAIRVTAWIYRKGGSRGSPRVRYLDPRVPVESPDSKPLIVEQIPEDAPEPSGPVPPPPR